MLHEKSSQQTTKSKEKKKKNEINEKWNSNENRHQNLIKRRKTAERIDIIGFENFKSFHLFPFFCFSTTQKKLKFLFLCYNIAHLV